MLKKCMTKINKFIFLCFVELTSARSGIKAETWLIIAATGNNPEHNRGSRE